MVKGLQPIDIGKWSVAKRKLFQKIFGADIDIGNKVIVSPKFLKGFEISFGDEYPKPCIGIVKEVYFKFNELEYSVEIKGVKSHRESERGQIQTTLMHGLCDKDLKKG